MQKTGANLNALTRVAQYMNREKKPVNYGCFSSSQFNYCPLIYLDIPQ